jgi:hypothetical protein
MRSPRNRRFRGEMSDAACSVSGPNPLPFIWDQGNGQLYLDLNRNDDLSDDPKAGFPARTPAIRQLPAFENVRFELPIHGMPQRLRFNLSLYDFGQLGGSIALRSYWSGKAVLQDREWELGVSRSCKVSAGRLTARSCCCDRGTALGSGFSVGDGSLDTFACGSALFFLGQTYEVERRCPPNPAPVRDQP